MCGASWCGSPWGVSAAVWVDATAGRRRLVLSDELGDHVRVKIMRRLRLVLRRIFRPFGRRFDDFRPCGRLLDGDLRLGRRLRPLRRHRLRLGRRRRFGFGRRRRRGLRRRSFCFWRGRGLRRRLCGRAQVGWRLGRGGRGLRRGFGVFLAVHDLVEFAQRYRFDRNRFRTVRESRRSREAKQKQRQHRPVERGGARKTRI